MLNTVRECLNLILQDGVGPNKFFNLVNKKTVLLDHPKTDEIINFCQKYNIEIIPFNHKSYPKELNNINDKPPIIFAKGNIDLLNQKSIAIVGSRNSSVAGNNLAYSWSRELSENFVVVSGLAQGIDRFAHLGAIKNTIAVMPGSINLVYPEKNQDVYDQILANNGLIISEQLPGTLNTAGFAKRNRIITGLSDGTIIVEAEMKSGTMKTAKLTQMQNKILMSVPGHPFDFRYIGNNYLIQNGASLVTSIQDVYDLMNINVSAKSMSQVKKYELCKEEEMVYNVLSFTPVSIDDILCNLVLDIKTIRKAIMTLDLKNLIFIYSDGKISKT